jgi:hypothetical protein
MSKYVCAVSVRDSRVKFRFDPEASSLVAEMIDDDGRAAGQVDLRLTADEWVQLFHVVTDALYPGVGPLGHRVCDHCGTEVEPDGAPPGAAEWRHVTGLYGCRPFEGGWPNFATVDGSTTVPYPSAVPATATAPLWGQVCDSCGAEVRPDLAGGTWCHAANDLYRCYPFEGESSWATVDGSRTLPTSTAVTA